MEVHRDHLAPVEDHQDHQEDNIIKRYNFKNNAMTKIIIPILLFASLFSINAQSVDDVMLISRDKLSGTSRSIALGGAMGAIGGDFTSLSVNPAGIAVYRTSEFSLSQGLTFNNSSSDYWDTNRTDNKTYLPFNQIGYVGSFRPMREATSGIISSHFAFGYNRINSFDNVDMMQGFHTKTSLLDRFVIDGRGISESNLVYDANYTTNLGYQTHAINPHTTDPNAYMHKYDYIIETEGVDQLHKTEKDGYGGEYLIAGGFNINNMLMVGGSLNIRSLDYSENNTQIEKNSYGFAENIFDDDLTDFKYKTFLNLRSSSIGAKFGVIVKPIHAIRLGIAYHTPLYTEFAQEYHATMNTNFVDGVNRSETSDYYTFDYALVTPSKWILSGAFLIADKGLLSVDYEYQDYSNAHYKITDIDYDWLISDLNNEIKNTYQAVKNIKVGAEIKLDENWMIRGGAALYGSPIKSDLLTNKMKYQTISGGIGYRIKNYFIDMTYQMLTQKHEYYLYNWTPDESNIPREDLRPAFLTNTSNQISFTMGWKF